MGGADRVINIRVLRRLTQAFFIGLLLFAPVFDMLRYDVAAKDLYILRHVWQLGLGQGFYEDPSAYGPGYVAVHFFLRAVLPWLVVLSVFPLLGVVLGRAFCGWACPEGALFEFADFLTLKLLGRRSVYQAQPNDPPGARGNILVYGLITALYLITVPPLFGVMLTGYFIAPSRIWHELYTGELSTGLTAGITGVSIYMVLTFVLVRHGICKYLCGAGLMQMLLGWASPVSLAIIFHRERKEDCTDCRCCEEVCFMDVKPRSLKRNINCVNCGECVEACRRELGKDRGLFYFGPKGKDI